MEEKVKISMLCQLYGKLLTKKQFEFIDDYYIIMTCHYQKLQKIII